MGEGRGQAKCVQGGGGGQAKMRTSTFKGRGEGVVGFLGFFWRFLCVRIMWMTP